MSINRIPQELSFQFLKNWKATQSMIAISASMSGRFVSNYHWIKNLTTILNKEEVLLRWEDSSFPSEADLRFFSSSTRISISLFYGAAAPTPSSLIPLQPLVLPPMNHLSGPLPQHPFPFLVCDWTKRPTNGRSEEGLAHSPHTWLTYVHIPRVRNMEPRGKTSKSFASATTASRFPLPAMTTRALTENHVAHGFLTHSSVHLYGFRSFVMCSLSLCTVGKLNWCCFQASADSWVAAAAGFLATLLRQM